MDSQTETATDSQETRALALVHQGWNHLQLQRPQAAWAAWHRALRCVADHPAAVEALARLESAAELPAAARASYAFRAPRDAARRARWNQAFQGRAPEDLDQAVATFAALAAEDPGDGVAAYNEALCLAWLGRNAAAVGALDLAVRNLACDDFDRAVDAWTIAEVLRQGAGAERLADDLRYSWIIPTSDAGLLGRLGKRATLVPVPTARDPITEDPHADAEIFEWLDRPMPSGTPGGPGALDIPRLLATVVRTGGTLRLSSPDSQTLDEIQAPLARAAGDLEHSIDREAMPLPLSLLDAALWTFRLPQGLDLEHQNRLTRGAVETYFEDRWIHVPRHGLDGLTPLEAAARAGEDALLRAKLTAVIRIREQLGARARTAALYQGYPFDRLRRRLGLEPGDPATIDPDDASCMSGAELDQLDPAALDDVHLADAFASAAGLRDDTRTVRFAAPLAHRQAPVVGRLDLEALFAPLVRAAMTAGRAEEALEWLDRGDAFAVEAGQQRQGRTFAVWRAEIDARSGDPESALKTYEALLAAMPGDADLAIDAAETFLDNGYPAFAQPLLLRARDEARGEGDLATARRAEMLVDEIKM
jgi:tetratricopeptide (TPR) repeat protein